MKMRLPQSTAGFRRVPETASPVLLFVLASLAAPLCANDSVAQFNRLKSLAGEWVGREAEGAPVRSSYRLVSGGKILVATLRVGDLPEMMTVYYLDSRSLMLTHYCSVDNDPRMRAEPATDGAKSLTFTFVDAANLSNPADAHTHNLTLAFESPDKLTEKWTWRKNGHDRYWIFQLHRPVFGELSWITFKHFFRVRKTEAKLLASAAPAMNVRNVGLVALLATGLVVVALLYRRKVRRS